MVGTTGVEPARISPLDPKSNASANSATRPSLFFVDDQRFTYSVTSKPVDCATFCATLTS